MATVLTGRVICVSFAAHHLRGAPMIPPPEIDTVERMAHSFVFRRPAFAARLITAGMLLAAGCSGDRQPPGEVIEIEAIEIIEPEDPAAADSVEKPPPTLPEPSADASS